jgi:hypothetical protein
MRRFFMIKTIAAASLLAIALASSANAKMICDGPSFTAAQAKIDAMADGEEKEAVQEMLKMAQEAMNAKKMKKCLMHMSSTERGL